MLINTPLKTRKKNEKKKKFEDFPENGILSDYFNGFLRNQLSQIPHTHCPKSPPKAILCHLTN